eukprot:103504-Chlamydomonas_euryale.AAC.1
MPSLQQPPTPQPPSPAAFSSLQQRAYEHACPHGIRGICAELSGGRGSRWKWAGAAGAGVDAQTEDDEARQAQEHMEELHVRAQRTGKTGLGVRACARMHSYVDAWMHACMHACRFMHVHSGT